MSKQLIDMLDTGVVSFAFRKGDGSVRKMLATRNLNHIPKDAHPKGLKEVNMEIAVPVFDIDNNAWRSFKPEAVLSIDSYRNF